MSAQPSSERNKLYFGDNLDVLRRYIADASVDLIYLDPPFNSRQDYNVLFAEKDGSRSASQIRAFKDSWEWGIVAERSYLGVVETGGRLADAMLAFRKLLGGSDMLAYLAMMAERLIELRRVLKRSGSIYLHCDPTASHYLKLLMDATFGPELFSSEIIWKRTSAHNSARRWGPVHDSILFFSKSGSTTWNRVFEEYDPAYIERFYRHSDSIGRFRLGDLTGAGTRAGDSGAEWRGVNPTAVGRHWAVPAIPGLGKSEIESLTVQQRLDALEQLGLISWPKKGKVPQFRRYLNATRGVPIQDVISDIAPLSPHSQERLGYPTQKPEALLDRILRASSNEGDVILDPFCGCGTTVQVSQRLNRRWIGIDITHLAINLIKTRLADSYGIEIRKTYDVIGEPKDLQGAARLALDDRFGFENWALSLVYARKSEQKKGADRGVDGRKLFHDDSSNETRQMLLSVKSGHVDVTMIRDLRGAMEREKAEFGIFITLEPPSKPMIREALEAGFYKSPLGGSSPRMQIFTIQQLFDGAAVDYKALSDRTYKTAPRHRPAAATNLSLNLEPNETFERS